MWLNIGRLGLSWMCRCLGRWGLPVGGTSPPGRHTHSFPLMSASEIVRLTLTGVTRFRDTTFVRLWCLPGRRGSRLTLGTGLSVRRRLLVTGGRLPGRGLLLGRFVLDT
ncbi:MAG: hypothetical protein M3010_00340 [Candidatus Dormibacteraeota bacterium]|nr:hypothetical protein [Candidatus Dormibacteraeota bacterium]